MNQNFKSAMAAAAELTAAGNLSAATALIQRALAGDAEAAPSGATAGAGGQHAAGTVGGSANPEVIDVESRWMPDGERTTTAPAAGAATPLPQTPRATAGFDPAAFDPSAFGAGRGFGTGSPLGDLSKHLKSPDWQAFAADMASKAGAFNRSEAGPSARPGAAPPHGGKGSMTSGAFTAPAGSRDYLLYVPPGLDDAKGTPLVVMLHGCTQSPADFAAGTAMNALADRDGFIVLYPAQSKTANQSACWNWFNPRDQRAGGGEPSIIAGMAREVIAKHGIDHARVSVAGLSAGGAMAAILADAYPDLFTAVAVHSGLPAGSAQDLPSALNAMKRGSTPVPAGMGTPARAPTAGRSGKPVRTIVFHGRQDRTVHPSNGRQVVDAALSHWSADTLAVKREDGRSPGGRSFTRTVHADAAGRALVEQWEVQGAGHAWSGGSASGSYTDPQGPDASAALVAFFKAG